MMDCESEESASSKSKVLTLQSLVDTPVQSVKSPATQRLLPKTKYNLYFPDQLKQLTQSCCIEENF